MTTTSDAAETSISFDVMLNAAEVRMVTWRSLLLRLPRLLALWGIVTFVVAAFKYGRYLATGNFSPVAYAIVTMLVVGIAVFAALACYVLLQAAKVAEQIAARGPSRYEVSDDGFTSESENGRAELKWSAFGKLRLSDSAIIVRMKNADQYLLIPRRCVASQDWVPLTALFARHVSA